MSKFKKMTYREYLESKRMEEEVIAAERYREQKAKADLAKKQDPDYQKHIAEQMERSRLMNEARSKMFMELGCLVAEAEKLSAEILVKFEERGGNSLSFAEVKTLMAEFKEKIAKIYSEFKVIETESLKDKNNPIANRKKPMETLYANLLKKSPKFLIVAPVYTLNKAQVTNLRKLTDEEKEEIYPHLQEIGAFELETFAKDNKKFFESNENITENFRTADQGI